MNPHLGARAHLFTAPLLIVVLAAGLAGAVHAAEDETGARERAKQHFDTGLSLLDARDFAGAAREFEQSIAALESLPALYNIAIAYRGTGEYRRGLRALQRFQDLSATKKAPQSAVAGALALKTELSAKLARITFVIRGGSTGLVVGGERAAMGDGTVALELDPGTYELVVERAGFEPQITTRIFAEGSRETLELSAGTQPSLARSDPIPVPVPVPVTIPRVVAPAPIEDETEALYEEWWFWTAIALLAAAGATTAIVLANSSGEDPPSGGSTGTVIRILLP